MLSRFLRLRPAASLLRQTGKTFLRSMSTTGESALGDILTKEIEHEKSQSAPSSVVQEFKQALAGWDVDMREGEGTLCLTKEFGLEKISVTVDACNPQEPEIIDDEEEYRRDGDEPTPSSPPGFEAMIEVRKGDSIFAIKAMLLDFLHISGMSMERAQDDSEEAMAMTMENYDGPNFEELDQNFQEAIFSYLDERGINDEFADTVRQFCDVKEQGEYVRFLEKLNNFVKE